MVQNNNLILYVVIGLFLFVILSNANIFENKGLTKLNGFDDGNSFLTGAVLGRPYVYAKASNCVGCTNGDCKVEGITILKCTQKCEPEKDKLYTWDRTAGTVTICNGGAYKIRNMNTGKYECSCGTGTSGGPTVAVLDGSPCRSDSGQCDGANYYANCNPGTGTWKVSQCNPATEKCVPPGEGETRATCVPKSP